MYSRVFKNNQVTYGRPYQIKMPVGMDNLQDMTENADAEDEAAVTSDPEVMIENARKKCEKMISDAEAEAAKLLDEARSKADMEAAAIKEDAWQRGYAEGMEAAAEQSKALLEEADRIRQTAAEDYESILAGMEADILELSVKIARKAVAGELTANRDVILQLAASALKECSEKNSAVIRVSPSNAEYLKENMDRLAAMAEGAGDAEIKADSAMKPGDCIIETPLGNIDAGAETRLDKIEEAIEEEFEGR